MLFSHVRGIRIIGTAVVAINLLINIDATHSLDNQSTVRRNQLHHSDIVLKRTQHGDSASAAHAPLPVLHYQKHTPIIAVRHGTKQCQNNSHIFLDIFYVSYLFKQLVRHFLKRFHWYFPNILSISCCHTMALAKVYINKETCSNT